MASSGGHLAAVESLAAELESAGFEPVLVGGMALVILGSRRVTRDFDFLVAAHGPPMAELVRLMYRHRLELVTKLDASGDVVRTVDKVAVAAAKVGGLGATSLFFHNRRSGLRVDLLLDHPFPAHAVAGRAAKVKLRSRRIAVASPEDLLRLKEVARVERKSAADDQDVEFLRGILDSR